MLGFIAGLLGLGSFVKEGLRDQAMREKELEQHPEWMYYHDSQGRMHYAKTGELCYFHQDLRTKEKTLVNKNGHVLYNYSKANRERLQQKEIEFKKRNGYFGYQYFFAPRVKRRRTEIAKNGIIKFGEESVNYTVSGNMYVYIKGNHLWAVAPTMYHFLAMLVKWKGLDGIKREIYRFNHYDELRQISHMEYEYNHEDVIYDFCVEQSEDNPEIYWRDNNKLFLYLKDYSNEYLAEMYNEFLKELEPYPGDDAIVPDYDEMEYDKRIRYDCQIYYEPVKSEKILKFVEEVNENHKKRLDGE